MVCFPGHGLTSANQAVNICMKCRCGITTQLLVPAFIPYFMSWFKRAETVQTASGATRDRTGSPSDPGLSGEEGSPGQRSRAPVQVERNYCSVLVDGTSSRIPVNSNLHAPSQTLAVYRWGLCFFLPLYPCFASCSSLPSPSLGGMGRLANVPPPTETTFALNYSR